MHNAPLLGNGGELHASASLGWGARGAWSPADGLALVGGASHFDRTREDDTYGLFTAGPFEEAIAHTYIEGGAGAYLRLDDLHRLEGFAGYGSGSMTELEAGRFSMNVIELGYHRLVLQADYGMTSDIGSFRGAVGGSMRAARIWCYRYQTSGVPGDPPDAFMIEPAAFLRFGLHMLQFEVQLGGLLRVAGDDAFGTRALGLSFGLHGMIGR
jgi:hypothetical protein